MDHAEPLHPANPHGAPPPAGPPPAEPGAAPPVQAEAPGPSLEDMARLVDAAADRILAALQARAKSETFQQDLITRLHDELQEQVNRSAVLPVVTGVLRLQEEMEKVAERLRAAPGEPTPEQMLRQFTEFAEDLGTLLEQAGVVRFVDEAQGDQFNGSRQTLLGRDPTADASLNHRISARVRPGADFGKTLLRREAVRVYAFDPTLPAAAPPQPSTSEDTAP